MYKAYKDFEGVPVQFVGVYVTMWRASWGEPTIAFAEFEDDDPDNPQRKIAELEAERAPLRAELAQMKSELAYTNYLLIDIESKLRDDLNWSEAATCEIDDALSGWLSELEQHMNADETPTPADTTMRDDADAGVK